VVLAALGYLMQRRKVMDDRQATRQEHANSAS
jgi:hypothetical protein